MQHRAVTCLAAAVLAAAGACSTPRAGQPEEPDGRAAQNPAGTTAEADDLPARSSAHPLPARPSVRIFLDEDDRLEVRLTTVGSGSCPFEVDEATLEDSTLVLTDNYSPDQVCTADARENRLRWPLPTDLGATRLTDVRRVVVVVDDQAQDARIEGFGIID